MISAQCLCDLNKYLDETNVIRTSLQMLIIVFDTIEILLSLKNVP